MTEEDKHTDKPLYLNPVKIITLIGAIIAATLSGTALYENLNPPPRSSVEYVLDTSRGMKGKLGKVNKLERVANHILADLIATPDVPAALRLAGGRGCPVEYDSPAVDFGENNIDYFDSALSGVKPSGKSNIANAIKHAANDILRRSKEESAETATVYVYLGRMKDMCTRNPRAAIRVALNPLRAENVTVDFNFVGVKPSKSTRRLLKSLAREVNRNGFSSVVVYAKKPRDLATLPSPCDTPAEAEYSGDCS